MPSLTAQQRQTAIDAIIHMEGMDGSKDPYGPTKPGWGGGNSALSYGQFQNDISQGENKYDAMSSGQALLEMLENDNDDRTLDEKIVTHGSNPAGAKAIRNEVTPTDKTYNGIITAALSAPENVPIWQAQDRADENSVIDKLNEAIGYINDKNPAGAGSLSWSHLDPKALMALAVWTNQHQNIMPMVEALTAGASLKTPLTTTGLLDAIYQQPYFQGPKAYSSTDWQNRIDETVRYVNHKEHDNFDDFGPAGWLVPSAYGDTLPNGTDLGYLPSAAQFPTPAVDTHAQTAPHDQTTPSSAGTVELAADPGMAWDMQDAHASVLAYLQDRGEETGRGADGSRDDRVVPSATKALAPASPKPAAVHTTAALDMLDLYTGRIPYLDGDPTGPNALDSDAQPGPDASELYNQMITLSDRLYQTGLRAATASPAQSAGADIAAGGRAAPRSGLPAGSSISAVTTRADRGGVEQTEALRPPNPPRPGRPVASGRRDDPIFVYEVSTRVAH